MISTFPESISDPGRRALTQAVRLGFSFERSLAREDILSKFLEDFDTQTEVTTYEVAVWIAGLDMGAMDVERAEETVHQEGP